MYKIELAKSAVKTLESLDGRTQEKIHKVLEALKTNPYRSIKIKKLRGELKGRFRYRIGEIRIIYFIVEENKTIFVEASSIYK